MSLADFKPLPDMAISGRNNYNLPASSEKKVGGNVASNSFAPIFDFGSYANSLNSAMLQGNNPMDAVKGQFVNNLGNTLDQMGTVGQVLHVGLNLFMNRKGAAQQAQTQTITHGKMSQQAIQNQKAVCDGNITAIIESFQNGTIQNLEDAKSQINDAVNLINDKEAAKDKLVQEQEQLRQDNEGLAAKIQERQIVIKKTEKDGQTEVEFLDKDGNPVEVGEDAELADLIKQYQGNMSRLNVISIEVAALSGEQYTISQEETETQDQHEENQAAAEQEINTSVDEAINTMRQGITQAYNDFAPILQNDQNMHKLYQDVDKGLAIAQTGAALWDPVNRGQYLQNAAENLIASQVDKVGDQLGIQGVGALATGKTSVQEYAMQQITGQMQGTMRELLDGTNIDPNLTDALMQNMMNGNIQQA